MNDLWVKICPICGTEFEDHAYQLTIGEVGPFDSIACADEGLRRHKRQLRSKLIDGLLEAAGFDATATAVTPPTVDSRPSS